MRAHRLVVVVAQIGLAMLAADAGAQNPHPGSAPVNIVGPLPLPVTGNVNVTGSVSVAQQEPFQFGTVSTSFNTGSGLATLVVVPAGKRLVIEGVSANINVTQTGGLASVSVNIGGTFDRVNTLMCQQQGTSPNNLNHWFFCSTQVKLHAEPGQTVTFSVSTADSSSGGFFRAFASGYFVPAQ